MNKFLGSFWTFWFLNLLNDLYSIKMDLEKVFILYETYVSHNNESWIFKVLHYPPLTNIRPRMTLKFFKGRNRLKTSSPTNQQYLNNINHMISTRQFQNFNYHTQGSNTSLWGISFSQHTWDQHTLHESISTKLKLLIGHITFN